jgi:hypothetical protein
MENDTNAHGVRRGVDGGGGGATKVGGGRGGGAAQDESRLGVDEG